MPINHHTKPKHKKSTGLTSRWESHEHDRTQLLRLQDDLTQDLPGVEIMGKGYDPFVGCANATYVITGILNLSTDEKDSFTYNGINYQKPTVVSAVSLSDSYISIIDGKDIQTFQQDLATSVKIEGSYNFFSGSLNADFDSHSLTESDRSFSRCEEAMRTWQLQIPLEASMRTFLDDDFRNTLDNLDVDSTDAMNGFFTLYGSHVVTGAVFGGRALRTAATNKYTVDKTYDLSVVATESFRFASAQADAEEKVKYASAVSSFNASSETTQKTIGGDPTLALNVFNSSNSSLNDWHDSVKNAPVFIDFSSNNPLTPIWHLCADDEGGQRIRDGLDNYFYNTWAPKKSQELTIQPDYVDALVVIDGHQSDIGPPEGYTKINFDLNSGAKGDFIYLCDHKAKFEAFGQNKQAVTDLVVIYDDAPTPDGYTKLDNDLNKGAKGNYVYLCYKLDDYNQDTAILDINVIAGDHSDINPTYGYKKVDGDLNRGARGLFLYFEYTKQGWA